jgi:hypothetical protein
MAGVRAQASTMKRFLAAIAALGFLAIAVPAIAEDRHDHDHDHDRFREQSFHHGPPPRHYAPPPRRMRMYREGQVWNGHHLTNRGGHWGYYQPRNGVQLFINIPL